MAENKSISFVYKILDQFSGPLDKIGKKIDESTHHMGMFGKAVGAILTAGGIEEIGSQVFEFGKKSLEAFEEAELGAAQLKKTLKNIEEAGGTGWPAFEELEKSAQKLGKTSLFDDSDIVARSFGPLVKYSAVGKFGIDNVSMAAQNLAFSVNKFATGTDLEQASNMLGRVLQDPFKNADRMMRQYHIAFTNSDVKLMEQYKKTNNEVAAREFLFNKIANAPGVKDAMKAEMGTGAGRRLFIEKQMKEMQEALGGKIAPFVEKFQELALKVMPVLGDSLEKVNKFLDVFLKGMEFAFNLINENKLVFEILGAAMVLFALSSNAAAIGSALLNIQMNIAAIRAMGWSYAQWLLNAALDANPIGAVIIAVAALAIGMTLLITHWKQFTKLLEDKPAFNLIGLILPIVTIPILIIAHWQMLKKMFGEVIDYIKIHWKDLLITLAGPIGLALEIIKHWKQVGTVIGDVFNIFSKGGLAKFKGDLTHIFDTPSNPTPTPIAKQAPVNVSSKNDLTVWLDKGMKAIFNKPKNLGPNAQYSRP